MRIVLLAAFIFTCLFSGACVVHTYDGPAEDAPHARQHKRHKRLKARRKHRARKHRARKHRRPARANTRKATATGATTVKLAPKRPAPAIVSVAPSRKVVSPGSVDVATMTPPASVDKPDSGGGKIAPVDAMPGPSVSAGAGSVAVVQRNWVHLGQRQVKFRVDHDTIPVTIRDGRFRAIRLHAAGSPLEMFKVKVSFGNGTHYTPE